MLVLLHLDYYGCHFFTMVMLLFCFVILFEMWVTPWFCKLLRYQNAEEQMNVKDPSCTAMRDIIFVIASYLMVDHVQLKRMNHQDILDNLLELQYRLPVTLGL